MSDTPEASNAARGQSDQASRATTDDSRRYSFQRSRQDVGFMRRNYSDGDMIQPWSSNSNEMGTAGQSNGPSLHRFPSVDFSTQSTNHNEGHSSRRGTWDGHPHHTNNWHDLQVYLNNTEHGDPARDDRARQQQASLMQQRKRIAERAERDRIQRGYHSRVVSLMPTQSQSAASRQYRPTSLNLEELRNRYPRRHDHPDPSLPTRPAPAPPFQSPQSPGHTLPRWQPDSEVSNCPICKSSFTFMNRRHHCRKCGRVVCAKCSPHRITIPRQYIVRPPAEDGIFGSEGSADGDEGNGITGLSSPTRLNSALGGGEEVRLCNPCVPDPNPLPPSYNYFQGSQFANFSRPSPPHYQRGDGWSVNLPSQRPRSASQRHSTHLDGLNSRSSASDPYRTVPVPNPLGPHVRSLCLASREGFDIHQARNHPHNPQPYPFNHIPSTAYGSAPDNRNTVCHC